MLFQVVVTSGVDGLVDGMSMGGDPPPFFLKSDIMVVNIAVGGDERLTSVIPGEKSFKKRLTCFVNFFNLILRF